MERKTGENGFKESEILQKIQHYCSYRERCLQEVKSKLKELGAVEKQIAKLIDQLIEENFIDEKRYAEVFARGKFRINKWGRNKIRTVLRSRNIPESFIQASIDEIDDDEYSETLKNLVLKKAATMKNLSRYEKDQKLAAYAASKGYESDIIWKVIQDIF